MIFFFSENLQISRNRKEARYVNAECNQKIIHRSHTAIIRVLLKRMKYFALLLVATVGYCQQFTNGQAARLVIGQPSFTEEHPGFLNPEDPNDYFTSDAVLGGVSGLAYANNRLYAVDSNRLSSEPINNRVMVYTNVAGLVPGPTDTPVQGTRCPACLGPANLVMGQPDFTKATFGRSSSELRLPTAVATDGVRVAVADTNNNRVLIWNSPPAYNGQPADVVIGQVDFTSIKPVSTDPASLRGPQGVWFQNGKFFIADTQNHRVLIYNSVPTQNNASADVVIGQPDFFTAKEPSAEQILSGKFDYATQNNLLNPVSVTSDGTRLFVADLGHNRIMIWNSIPTSNAQAADIVLGQPDFISAVPNNASKVCASNGTDEDDNPTYPARCARTINFPRYVLTHGNQLFVADGGNDRVLVWNQIPTQNTAAADIVLGQINFEVNNTSEGGFAGARAVASDTLRAPTSLAHDGTNLYVSDTYNRRILIFTPGLNAVPYSGVRNSASLYTFALGTITFTPATLDTEIPKDVEITIKIGIMGGAEGTEKEYKYKTVEEDSFVNIVTKLATDINESNNPYVVALENHSQRQIVLRAKAPEEQGNLVTYSSTLTEGTTAFAATSGGATLSGGRDAASLAPGTLVSIMGQGFAEQTVAAPEGQNYPNELGNVEVFFDGIRAPVMFVSPNQINAQLSWAMRYTTSASAVVRTRWSDGRVTSTAAIAVPVVPANPGIYASGTQEPRQAVALHGSSYATGTISVDGSITEETKAADGSILTQERGIGDIATVIIAGSRRYSYTVVSGDTLQTVRDRLIEAINNGNDPDVTASAAGVFTRIRLTARRPGPDMNGIAMGQEVTGKDGAEASIILSPLNTGLCCANIEGAPVTTENPAVPGETIIVYATGLGIVTPDEAQAAAVDGQIYRGPVNNQPLDDFFIYANAGTKTANTLFARLKQGTVALYELVLELNSEMPSDQFTPLFIAQDQWISNIVTIPVVNPATQP